MKVGVSQGRPSFKNLADFSVRPPPLNVQNPLRWPEKFCRRPLTFFQSISSLDTKYFNIDDSFP